MDFDFDFRGGWKSPDFHPVQAGDENLLHQIADTIAFLWLGCQDANVNPVQVVEAGINRALESVNQSSRFTITETVPNSEKMRKYLARQARKVMEAGAELSDAEADALIQTDGVPNSIVFSYLRGEIDQYELPPFSFEENLNEPPSVPSTNELAKELDDEFTLQDGFVNYGDDPSEINSDAKESVIETLIESNMGAVAERLIDANTHIEPPVHAQTIREFVLYKVELEPLADSAEVSVETFQRILSEYGDEIEATLTQEYEIIEYPVPGSDNILGETE